MKFNFISLRGALKREILNCFVVRGISKRGIPRWCGSDFKICALNFIGSNACGEGRFRIINRRGCGFKNSRAALNLRAYAA